MHEVVVRLLDSWSNWNLEMSVFEKGGKPESAGDKLLGGKERTNNKLNPHMASTLGFEPGPQWWEVSALTTAPSFAPQNNHYILYFNASQQT